MNENENLITFIFNQFKLKALIDCGVHMFPLILGYRSEIYVINIGLHDKMWNEKMLTKIK